MKKITVNKTRILTAAAALVAVFSLAGCGSNAVQEIPRSAETSRSEEATPETAAPEATATPAPTPEPAPAVVVPTSVTLEQEGGILNNGMTWTLHATVLPEDAAVGYCCEMDPRGPNLPLALAWYRHAAKAGSAWAMEKVATFYEEGYGCTANRALADACRETLKYMR